MNRHDLPSINHFPIKVEGVEIYGRGYSQVLEIALQPGSVLSTQPGMIFHYDPKLQVDLDAAAKRIALGEHPTRVNIYNPTSQALLVALTTRQPGSIIPVDLRQTPQMVFKKGAFLAAFGLEWTISLRLAPTAADVMCCGGMGAVMSVIQGNNIVFLSSTGSVVEKYLAQGQVLHIDTCCVLGFDASMQQQLVPLGNGAFCCSGQRAWVSKFTGPGRIFIQSAPLQAYQIQPRNPTRSSNMDCNCNIDCNGI